MTEQNPPVPLSHSHGINPGIGQGATHNLFGGTVQKTHVQSDIMPNHKTVPHKFNKVRKHILQGWRLCQLLRGNPVDQGGLGMGSIFGTNIAVKRGPQINLQIPNQNRANQNDLISFPVKTGQFGITDDKGVLGKGPGLIKLGKGLPVPGNEWMRGNQVLGLNR